MHTKFIYSKLKCNKCKEGKEISLVTSNKREAYRKQGALQITFCQ